jgi:hypothetical protein
MNESTNLRACVNFSGDAAIPEGFLRCLRGKAENADNEGVLGGFRLSSGRTILGRISGLGL